MTRKMQWGNHYRAMDDIELDEAWRRHKGELYHGLQPEATITASRDRVHMADVLARLMDHKGIDPPKNTRSIITAI